MGFIWFVVEDSFTNHMLKCRLENVYSNEVAFHTRFTLTLT